MQMKESAERFYVHLPAYILIALCILNVNGFTYLMFDQGRTFSSLFIILPVVLIAKCGRSGTALESKLLIFSLIGYLVFGALFFNPLETEANFSSFVQTYFGSVLIVWAMILYTSYAEKRGKLGGVLIFIRNLTVVAAVSVIASPVLFELYSNLPPSFTYRFSGFFINPNEAGMVSSIGLGFILSVPFRSKLIQMTAIAVAVVAVALTLSKASMSLALVIMLVYISKMYRGIAGFLVVLIIGFTFFGGLNDIQVFERIVNYEGVNLSESQKERILEFGTLITLVSLDSDITTGRTDLWRLGLDRVLDTFPSGAGFGSLHSIEGGIQNYNSAYSWQGVHNTFLMLLGEAGLLPAILLVVSILLVGRKAVTKRKSNLEIILFLGLMVDMLSTQGAFAVRYQNIFTGLLFGMQAVHIKNRQSRKHLSKDEVLE